MTDTQSKIGHLLDGTEERDAIHVAVYPARAGCRLKPGEHVSIIEGRACQSTRPIGIVDPFLTEDVLPDQHCWVFLYPNTVTDMRHHWYHPAFETLPVLDKAISLRWMQEWVAEYGAGRTLEEYLEGGKAYIENNEYMSFEMNEDPDLPDEWWDHFEVLTGIRVQRPARQSFFTCSC